MKHTQVLKLAGAFPQATIILNPPSPLLKQTGQKAPWEIKVDVTDGDTSTHILRHNVKSKREGLVFLGNLLDAVWRQKRRVKAMRPLPHHLKPTILRKFRSGSALLRISDLKVA